MIHVLYVFQHADLLTKLMFRNRSSFNVADMIVVMFVFWKLRLYFVGLGDFEFKNIFSLGSQD